MASLIIGSICLSDIPKSQIKAVTLKDGTVKKYLNIAVCERKEVGKFGHTHYISCAPKKEERIEGEQYFIGDLKAYDPQPSTPSFDDVSNAPIAPDNGDSDDLPF